MYVISKLKALYVLLALVLFFPTLTKAQSHQDRAGEILFKNNRSDKGDYPFILEVKVVSEQSSALVLDITYFMSDTIGDNYSISLITNRASWAYTRNSLRPGIHIERITVSFNPQEANQKQSHSTELIFSINRFENCVNGCNCKDIGIVFNRSIKFEKLWSN